MERRFCPRCGTTLVAGLRFCPSCGLDTTAAGRPLPDGIAGADELAGSDDGGSSALETDAASTATPAQDRSVPSSPTLGRLDDSRGIGTAIVIAAMIVAVGLVVFGFLTSPQRGPAAASQGAVVGPDGSTIAAPAVIVGVSFESPADGQVVGTKDVTIIGLAPPGLKVTRDVSFGLDQHATADGTGHWAMTVGLDEGENNLVFRLGDDRSTEKRLRVTYTPQAP
jgi:hypothetical protein